MSQKIETIGDNQSELLAFCRFLVRVDSWNADQILALLESPHRWQAEYTFWQENKEAMENGELTNGEEEEEEESGINYAKYNRFN